MKRSLMFAFLAMLVVLGSSTHAAVTSVGTSCGLSGGPITTSGTISSVLTPINQTGSAYSYAVGDCGNLFKRSNSGAAMADTLLNPATAGSGYYLNIFNADSNAVDVLTPSTGNIDGAASITLQPGANAVLASDGTNYRLAGGSYLASTAPYTVTGGLTARAPVKRAAPGPVYNPLDYGALGTNSASTIGTTYGSSLAALAGYTTPAGATPFAPLTNTAFGLTFTLTNSADCPNGSTTCTFLETNSDSNYCVGLGWCVTGGLAAWKDPNYRNRLVPSTVGAATNTYVATSTGTCGSSIFTGTTISAGSGSFVLGNSNYGKLTLSHALTGDCPSGSTWTVTISNSALQTMTKDWLGIQAAIANAWLNGGGEVAIPAGIFNVTQDIMNPTGVSGGGTVSIHGAGMNTTYVEFAADIGDNHYLFNSNSWLDSQYISDLSSYGPGSASSISTTPLTYVRGIHLGDRSVLQNLLIFGYYSSLTINGDHINITNINSQEDFCAAEFEEYANSTGDIFFRDTNLASENFAGECIAATNVSDYSFYSNVSFGSSPYGIYKFSTPSTVTGAFEALTNNHFDPVYFENTGNYGIYALNGSATQCVNNTFVHGSAGVGNSSAPMYALPNLGSPAFIACDIFASNTMIGTNWGGYATVQTSGSCAVSGTTLTTSGGFTGAAGLVLKGTDGSGNPFIQQTTIVSGSGTSWVITPGSQSFVSGTCYGLTPGSGITEAMILGGAGGNHWVNDSGFVTLASAAIAPIESPGTSGNAVGNDFVFGGAQGFFAHVEIPNGAILGQAIYALGNTNYYNTLGTGQPFAGIAGNPCLDGSKVTYLCPLYLTGERIFTKQTNSTDSIAAGVPVYNSGNGVVAAGIYQPIGYTDGGTGTVNGVVGDLVNLGPSPSAPALVTASAAGTNQAGCTVLSAATTIATVVPSGSGFCLPAGTVNGTAITIQNDQNSNLLLVYPPQGAFAQIQSLGANNPDTVAINTTTVYKQASSTQWYRVQ